MTSRRPSERRQPTHHPSSCDGHVTCPNRRIETCRQRNEENTNMLLAKWWGVLVGHHLFDPHDRSAAPLQPARPPSISVSGSVAVSPSDASCTVTATMAPVSMSTPCSVLWARCVRPSLHLRDLRVRVLRRFPLLVRRFLVLPRTVEPSQLRPRRRLNTRRLRQPPNERLVGFSRVPPLDTPHRRVRFQRRRVNADRLPPNQTRCGQPLQNPREVAVGNRVAPVPPLRSVRAR